MSDQASHRVYDHAPGQGRPGGVVASSGTDGLRGCPASPDAAGGHFPSAGSSQVPPRPPLEHRFAGYAFYADRGYVAWCRCGLGSPMKPTAVEARASLDLHLADPDKVTA
jgi:hypothetical protein